MKKGGRPRIYETHEEAYKASLERKRKKRIETKEKIDNLSMELTKMNTKYNALSDKYYILKQEHKDVLDLIEEFRPQLEYLANKSTQDKKTQTENI